MFKEMKKYKITIVSTEYAKTCKQKRGRKATPLLQTQKYQLN